MELKGADDLHAEVLQKTLAEVASRTEHSEHDTAERCCVICLDNVSEACEARPCGHADFDYLCLVSWLQEQQNCPLCKSEVKSVEYEASDENGEVVKRNYAVPAKKSKAAEPPTQPARHGAYAAGISDFRRRRRAASPQPRPVTENEAILRRRHVYSHQLYSLHVGSNQLSQYRDLTPELFQTRPELISRARQWLRRELQVFEFLSTPATAQNSRDPMTRRRANNAEFLLEYIIAILKTVDTQGSLGQAENMLQEFLGRENTKLLLHELRNFLRSPYSIEVWDRKVQYDESKKRSTRSGEEAPSDERPQASKRRRGHGHEEREGWTQPDVYRPRYERDFDPRRDSRRRS